jgi:hypothetical protein
MKSSFKPLGLMFLAVGLAVAVAGCEKKQGVTLWQSLANPDDIQQLKSFVAEKEAQANAATNEAPRDLSAYLAAAKEGDWATVNNMMQDFDRRSPMRGNTGAVDKRLCGTDWQIIMEVWGGLQAFAEGNEKYSALYASDIINSIPRGSIYFGGTDAGRFLVTAMEKDQAHGDPFFTLTQNALADNTYLDYLRAMYGDKIYVPTLEDLQNCFNDYYADVQRRMKINQLKPGEDISVDPDTGKMRVGGQVAVMQINALLVKIIFDSNTNRDYYVQESFPLDWMYPYLEPHGLIFKLNRQPLDRLSDETVQTDRDYWAKTITPMIGDWLHEDTSVADIAAFNEKVFLNHDFGGFTGDTNFVLNKYSYRTFSKDRCSIADLYAWRAKHSDDAAEKDRMNRAADFAYRQAWALCPYLPETVYRYVQFLMEQENRKADALLIAETAAKFPVDVKSGGVDFEDLINNVKNAQ